MYKSKKEFIDAVESCYPIFKNKNLDFFLWAELSNICICIIALEPKENSYVVENIKETIKFAALNERFPWDKH